MKINLVLAGNADRQVGWLDVVLQSLGQRSDLGPACRAFHNDGPRVSVLTADYDVLCHGNVSTLRLVENTHGAHNLLVITQELQHNFCFSAHLACSFRSRRGRAGGFAL